MNIWKIFEYNNKLIRAHPDKQPQISSDKGKTWENITFPHKEGDVVLTNDAIYYGKSPTITIQE